MDAHWLDPYLPQGTVNLVSGWLKGCSLTISVKRPRRSKLGDFKSAQGQSPAAITINTDLGPHQFLVTLTHEIAHYLTWSRYGRRVAPHGPEWKKYFGLLLTELSDCPALTTSFRQALQCHGEGPKSASHYDQAFASAIAQADGNEHLVLDDIAEGDAFTFRDRRFVKLKANRTRCRCIEVQTGAEYRISKIAPVERMSTARQPSAQLKMRL